MSLLPIFNVDINQVTNNSKNDYNPEVSDYDDIVYEHEFSYSDTDIQYHFFNDEECIVAQTTANEGYSDISSLGHVAFETEYAANDQDIVYYDYFTDSTTTVASTTHNE